MDTAGFVAEIHRNSMEPCSAYRKICMAWVGGAQCGIVMRVDVPELGQLLDVLRVLPVAEARQVAVGAAFPVVLRGGLAVHLQDAAAGPAEHARAAGAGC